jgi:hypothetical protein
VPDLPSIAVSRASAISKLKKRSSECSPPVKLRVGVAHCEVERAASTKPCPTNSRPPAETPSPPPGRRSELPAPATAELDDNMKLVHSDPLPDDEKHVIRHNVEEEYLPIAELVLGW